MLFLKKIKKNCGNNSRFTGVFFNGKKSLFTLHLRKYDLETLELMFFWVKTFSSGEESFVLVVYTNMHVENLTEVHPSKFTLGAQVFDKIPV